MISVIIPTHNRTNLLFFELERIYKQKDVEFEVIVVNDVDGPDPTDAITTFFPEVHYIKSAKIQGPSEKHKAGLRVAKGNYLYIPDDDDFLIDEYFFKKAVDILETDESLAFVSGGVNLRYENEAGVVEKKVRQRMNVQGHINGINYLQNFQSKLEKPSSTVSTIFRKKAFDEKKALNMLECSDSSMYMLCLLWGDAYIMNDVVAEYRIRLRGPSLTTTLSIPFIMNVLEQKEFFYFEAKMRLKDPHFFWLNQIKCTYNILAGSNNSRVEKIKVLNWCMKHSHGSLRIIFFVINRWLKQLCLLLK